MEDYEFYLMGIKRNWAVFIFTCNNSDKLSNIIGEVWAMRKAYNIHIVDDSHLVNTIEENRSIVNNADSMSYLGIEEFRKFYYEDCLYRRGVTYLGTENWNLGTARNFALDYSLSMNYEKILFIDDDISDIAPKNVEEGFVALYDDNFISCNLAGVGDDSIVGHISKQLDVSNTDPQLLSGGFWFLNPNKIHHRFYNIYNEDWIMQLLEYSKERIVLPFSVRHNGAAKKVQRKDVYFQEIGEIVVEGLIENTTAISMDARFWEGIIERRISYIEDLIEQAHRLKKVEQLNVLNNLINWLKKQNGLTIIETLNEQKYDKEKYKI